MSHNYFLSILLILSLFPQTAFALSSKEQMKELRNLRKRVEKLEKQHEQELSQGASSPMSDKEKIAYMAQNKNLPIGTYLGVMNPDLSIIVDTNAYFTDDDHRPDRNKVRLREGEIALAGWLYPGIRGDFFIAFEQEYGEDGQVEGDVDLEAATVSFLDLPLDINAKVGRMFVEFGEMNKIHQHHRATVDQPLVLEHFFGNHSWIDDGIQADIMLPNPPDWFWKVEASYFNGNPLGRDHVHEDEDHGDEVEEHDLLPLDRDRMAVLRTFLNIPSEDNSMDLNLSYSLALQDGEDFKMHSIGGTFIYRHPGSYKKLTWKNELIIQDSSLDDTKNKSMGGYSQIKFNWNAYWDMGARYDWTEFSDDNDNHISSGSAFVTYHFTETTFVRTQYRHRNEPGDRNYDEAFIQIVWGIGPHSHRLEN